VSKDPLFTVTFPTEALANSQRPKPAGTRFHVADIRSADWAAVAADTDMVVVPYMTPATVLQFLEGSSVSIVQSQMVGYDGVEAALPPGMTYCNAGGVHEPATGELTLALILASLRGLPEAALSQPMGTWNHQQHPGLADKRVLVLGVGRVGREICRRLEPFDVEITRVGRTARIDEFGAVEAISDLAGLLPQADVVVLAVLLSEETRGMVDTSFLSLMKDDALLVNVARGPVVNTDDLVAELATGRIMAALDVTDPEPLPTDHPLWSSPRALITPHLGGDTAAFKPRIEKLLREQIARAVRGDELLNVIFDHPATRVSSDRVRLTAAE
jgi:phosphoglycerate dehydrogenase-like enzyme